MSQEHVTIQDLIAALGRIRGWAAAVRVALEAGEAEAVVARVGGMTITNEHLVATQKITETWTGAVCTALESMEGRDTIRINVRESPQFPTLKPLGKKNLCDLGPIVGDQCHFDIRLWLREISDQP